jgi:hypothetical protein
MFSVIQKLLQKVVTFSKVNTFSMNLKNTKLIVGTFSFFFRVIRKKN